MSLRTPLGRVLGLGSAKGGSAHWVAQRITAVALTLLGLWFIGSLIAMGPGGHPAVVGWLASPLNAALALLLVVVSAWHANLGLQVVIEDYVSAKGARVVALVAVRFALILAGMIGVLAVLRVALGVAA